MYSSCSSGRTIGNPDLLGMQTFASGRLMRPSRRKHHTDSSAVSVKRSNSIVAERACNWNAVARSANRAHLLRRDRRRDPPGINAR
jgi:hypothetical protein